jgi:uncharacterized protein YjbJ (UPF0337 family)
MINQQELTGHWNEIRGKLKEKWANLSDDDLRNFNGTIDQLIGQIQQCTGETRETIERFLAQLSAEGSQFLDQARVRIEQTAREVNDQVRQGVESARQGYAEAERAVQNRPGQAIAVAFGAGLLAGVGVALFFGGRRQSTSAQGRETAEHIARHMLDAFAQALGKNARG